MVVVAVVEGGAGSQSIPPWMYSPNYPAFQIPELLFFLTRGTPSNASAQDKLRPTSFRDTMMCAMYCTTNEFAALFGSNFGACGTQNSFSSG